MPDYSSECALALEMLARCRNVLISGPPGTGKSRLLAEVAAAFAEGFPGQGATGEPLHLPNAPIPIPPAKTAPTDADANRYPAPDKEQRKVFRTVFHQSSKHREFVSGMVPVVGNQQNAAGFRVVPGTLYRASEHAKSTDGASLLIIDEINRGPAVQIFGGAIVAIEADKRLAVDGSQRQETQYFELLDPTTADTIEYALPNDLFILAAMNQADASVEPLDVAFLRRWEPLKLAPNPAILRTYFGLPEADEAPPDAPTETRHVLTAAVHAWSAVNKRISIGRGSEFQLGHGVLMGQVEASGLSLEEALQFVAMNWAKVHAHVEEVFFGDVRGVAAALNALEGIDGHPFQLVASTFADALRYSISGPLSFTSSNIYAVLRAVGQE